jgi:hypothetical protein
MRDAPQRVIVHFILDETGKNRVNLFRYSGLKREN